MKNSTSHETFHSTCNFNLKKPKRKPFCLNFSLCKSEDINNLDLYEPDVRKSSYDRQETIIGQHYSSFINRNSTDSIKDHEPSIKNIKTNTISNNIGLASIQEKKQENSLKKDLFLLKNNQRVIIAKVVVKNFRLNKGFSVKSYQKTQMSPEKTEISYIDQRNLLIQQEILKNLALKLQKTCQIVLNLTPSDGVSLYSVYNSNNEDFY